MHSLHFVADEAIEAFCANNGIEPAQFYDMFDFEYGKR